jgi:CheY-specific phosphatase CheX
MEKLLYIANSRKVFKSFEDIVVGFLETDFVKHSASHDCSGYSMVIIEYFEKQQNFHTILEKVTQKCNQSQIPLILSMPHDKMSKLNADIMNGISGVIEQPYDSEKVISLIKMLKSLEEGISIPETKFLNTFVNAISEVLQINTGKEIKHKGIYLKEEYSPVGDISASVYISGIYTGVLELTFLKSSVKDLLSSLYVRDELSNCDQTCLDGVGEIINQVSGKVKSQLWEDGMNIDFSLPKLKCLAQNPYGCIRSNMPYHQLHFEFNSNPFLFNIQLSSLIEFQTLEQS